ncbi:MAG TPA: hypothetical protein VHL85_05005 [Burkholderiales bacterium]|nr:hypothetical protein [Burkholderiales bacterium]
MKRPDRKLAIAAAALMVAAAAAAMGPQPGGERVEARLDTTDKGDSMKLYLAPHQAPHLSLKRLASWGGS